MSVFKNRGGETTAQDLINHETGNGVPNLQGSLKKESEVAQSCPILCDPMDCSLPGSSVLLGFDVNVVGKLNISVGFPGGSDNKESACSAGDPVQPLGQKDPLEKGMATHSSILAWRIPCAEEPGRQGEPYSPWGHKSWT